MEETNGELMGLFGKKKPASDEPKIGIKEKLVVWFISKWIKDGLEGKKGTGVMESLKKINGLKSAILLALLLGEGAAKATGHDAGPLFGVLHGVLGSLGWSADAQTVDLASQGVVGAVGLWAIYGRAKVWYAQHYGAKK